MDPSKEMLNILDPKEEEINPIKMVTEALRETKRSKLAMKTDNLTRKKYE